MARPIIFIVDDEQSTRRLASDLQSRYGENYRIVAAHSGSEALSLLQQFKDNQEPVALLLINTELPDVDGIEFLIQATSLFPNAKRVLLTTYQNTDRTIRAIRKVRVDEYLVKPCQPPNQRLYPTLDDLLTDWESRTNPRAPLVRVIGSRFSPPCHELRDFLARNCVPFQWLDVERDEEARRLIGDADDNADSFPIVIFPDGTRLTRPSKAEIAEKIGLKVHPEEDFYDLIIVGGGPAGLASSVYGASEGLRTILVERHAPGGQAGLSSMIENYLGFPAGLSGADLARRAVAQARKFEVEIVNPQLVSKLRVDGPSRFVALNDGMELQCHVVLLACGVEWRRLDVPGIERLVGAGVYYGGTLAEAFFCRNEDIYVVGGANSAGQAAIHFSRYARTVTMLVRGDSLAESMSQYLIDQITAMPKIKVRLRTTVTAVQGDTHLEAITIFDANKGEEETLPATALFIFIGALPHTEWLQSLLKTDRHGFILTGPDLAPAHSAPLDSQGKGNSETRLDGPQQRESEDRHQPESWKLNREPFWLEASVPGIFAAGDVRHGSVKRVAAGVGEGATAVQFIHQYLASTER